MDINRILAETNYFKEGDVYTCINTIPGSVTSVDVHSKWRIESVHKESHVVWLAKTMASCGTKIPSKVLFRQRVSFQELFNNFRQDTNFAGWRVQPNLIDNPIEINV